MKLIIYTTRTLPIKQLP